MPLSARGQNSPSARRICSASSYVDQLRRDSSPRIAYDVVLRSFAIDFLQSGGYSGIDAEVRDGEGLDGRGGRQRRDGGGVGRRRGRPLGGPCRALRGDV